jgi:WD40 repeat protein
LSASVHSLAFTPDGARAVTGGQDGKLRVWDVKTGRELRILPADGSRAGIGKLAVSPDGHYALSVSRDNTSIRLWDVTP